MYHFVLMSHLGQRCIAEAHTRIDVQGWHVTLYNFCAYAGVYRFLKHAEFLAVGDALTCYGNILGLS